MVAYPYQVIIPIDSQNIVSTEISTITRIRLLSISTNFLVSLVYLYI